MKRRKTASHSLLSHSRSRPIFDRRRIFAGVDAAIERRRINRLGRTTKEPADFVAIEQGKIGRDCADVVFRHLSCLAIAEICEALLIIASYGGGRI